MNVAFDPWIPVVDLSGKPKLASLCEVLTEGHLLSDLSVRPHERVSLMRLFLCVTHAALDGPKDYDEWCEVPRRLPEAAQKYLESWRDSFELFHATKPWLQFPDLESGKAAEEGWGPVSKLGFFMASGANTTLFDHDGMDNEGRSIPLASTVLSMLSFQCFSPGGLISQAFWNGSQTSKSSKDGPCVPASMVHALLRRENLLATIQANLPSFEDVAFSYGGRPLGRPVWEMMPTSFGDVASKENATASYIGRLVPITRLIRLHRDGARMLMGDGFPYPPFTDGHPPEPSAIVIIRNKDKKPEPALLSFRPGRAVWRELGSIVIQRNAQGVGGPLCLRSLSEEQSCDLVVASLARDQATILDTMESVYHVSAKLRAEQGAAVYQSGVQDAEDMARRLGWAIEDYRRVLDGGWEGRLKTAGAGKGELLSKLHAASTVFFWTAVEKSLGLLMEHIDALGTDEAERTALAWKRMIRQTAQVAFESVCGQETPRQMKAFAEGWKKLTSQPKDSEKQSRKEGEEE